MSPEVWSLLAGLLLLVVTRAVDYYWPKGHHRPGPACEDDEDQDDDAAVS